MWLSKAELPLKKKKKKKKSLHLGVKYIQTDRQKQVQIIGPIIMMQLYKTK